MLKTKICSKFTNYWLVDDEFRGFIYTGFHLKNTNLVCVRPEFSSSNTKYNDFLSDSDFRHVAWSFLVGLSFPSRPKEQLTILSTEQVYSFGLNLSLNGELPVLWKHLDQNLDQVQMKFIDSVYYYLGRYEVVKNIKPEMEKFSALSDEYKSYYLLGRDSIVNLKLIKSLISNFCF